MTRRIDRINGLLRQEISDLISKELNDPRLGGVVSVTYVDTSVDLSHARVHVSVFAQQDRKETVLNGIRSGLGFIRRELRGRLRLRHIPTLELVLDESLDEASHISQLIDQANPTG